MGRMESGATNPPEIDDSKGNEVKGRQIKAIAQKISQIRSKLFLRFSEVWIT